MHIPIKKKKGVCIFMGKRNQENQNDNRVHEVGQDSTKYGEFISSYFAWVSLPNQKEKVEELENMTKKDEKKRQIKKNKDKERKINNKSQERSKNKFDFNTILHIIIIQVKESQRQEWEMIK